ncbi:DUF397 domain-containing protein [Amycolatopsis sp. CB00013]|uniref:DUF397 domain-containing protein n=1 Tax=Amycolatopsis sp. CB00013 TaxID=1703945 RepID=UPI00093BAD94|nr:DUF397 domain-containing protein [Amycolatopsis sp. CB00013]
MTGDIQSALGDAEGEKLTWFKSSRCHPRTDPNCVEVAFSSTTVHIRNSQYPDGEKLAISHQAWRALIATLNTDSSKK